jgi:pimeloyl-ACP methyl ester carboxylesterase
MTQQVEDLTAVLRALDAAPAHLVGHSYGAFLALLLAIKTPTLVRSLVLAEPPVVTLFVSMPPKPTEIARLAVTNPRTAFGIVKFGATGIGPATAAFRRGQSDEGARIFGNAVLGRTTFQRLTDVRQDQVRANTIKAEFLGSGLAPLNGDDVRTVQAPTLLVTGQRSRRLFHRLTDRLEELLPHTERVNIPDASHIMHEDNPSTYNEAVSSFLAKQT